MTMQCATKDDVALTGVPLYEIRTEVMSASARICVVGGDAGMAEDARARLLELAGRWDDAAVDSEIGRINTGSGAPVPASPETVLLVGLALQAARETRGGYDPRALPRVLDGVGGFGRDDSATKWIERFVVDPRSGTVGIPPRAALDLGGIDRGLAADLVVADTLDAGAYGVCVDVGGHVRAAGAAPCRNGWVFAVEHPLAPLRVAPATAWGRRRDELAHRLHRPGQRAGDRCARGSHRGGRVGLARQGDRPGSVARWVSPRPGGGREGRRSRAVLLR